jgi:hypothetical protein
LSINGGDDGFLTKLNALGTALVYSTFLGGSEDDQCSDIAIDAAGRAYVAGKTESEDFPTTPGAFDTTFNDGDEGFVTKLSAAGTFPEYSTFLGGEDNDEVQAIAVDQFGIAYVAGETESAGFPVTAVTFDASYDGGGDDGFVAKLPMFDIGLQDESNGCVMLINSLTGDYTFCYGGKAAITGKTKIRKTGNTITLSDYRPDCTIAARVDMNKKSGSASMQSPQYAYAIYDKDITNNTCNCSRR